MERVVREQVVHELPPNAFEYEEVEQKLLGAIDAREDYRELVLGMLGSQVAGLYVPREKALYIVEEHGTAVAADDEHTILVHEIVHAMQDEHFDLGARVRWREDGTDSVAAVHALGEGDATLAMLLEKSRGEPIPDAFFESFETLLREGNRRVIGDRAPRALADALVEPYIEGLRFVRDRYATGGWDAVDAAWRDPPITTEQLLHPAKYVAREPPLPMSRVSVGPHGFVELTSGIVGELDLRDWLATYVELGEARTYAKGWGQGRTELFGRGDEHALRLRILWDSDSRDHAVRTAKSLAVALEKRFGRPRRVRSFTCFERRDLGPLALRADDSGLVVLAGPARLAPHIGTSDARCRDLDAWAKRTTLAR